MLVYKFNDPEELTVSIVDTDTGSGRVVLSSRVDLSGVTVLPYRTTEELKDEALKEAETLYRNIKSNLKVTLGGVRYDMSNRFDFDFQRARSSGLGVRVRIADGPTTSISFSSSGVLETKTWDRLIALADSLDADVVAIENGDYSLANLKAEESLNEGQ